MPIDKKAFSAAIDVLAGEFPPESGITIEVLRRLCTAYEEAKAKDQPFPEPTAAQMQAHDRRFRQILKAASTGTLSPAKTSSEISDMDNENGAVSPASRQGTDQPDDCRAEFEKWIQTLAENKHFNMVSRLPDGRYEYDNTARRWEGWKAARGSI